MNRYFCVPCYMELKKTREITLGQASRNKKEACWHCKRRRFCSQYDIAPKTRKTQKKEDPRD